MSQNRPIGLGDSLNGHILNQSVQVISAIDAALDVVMTLANGTIYAILRTLANSG